MRIGRLLIHSFIPCFQEVYARNTLDRASLRDAPQILIHVKHW
jgi:hypothetical protein